MIHWATFGGSTPDQDTQFGFMASDVMFAYYPIDEDNVAAVERLAKQLRETLNANQMR